MNIGAGIESLYLDGPASGFSEKAKNVAIAFVLNLIWIQVVMLFGQWLYGADINYGISTIFQFDFERNLRLEIFSACIFAPIVEEAIFRFAPMRISDALGRDFFLPIAIISQVIFGAMHGNGWMFNILIQGVGGCLMLWAYCRNGRCLWSSMALHCMWNSFWTIASLQ